MLKQINWHNFMNKFLIVFLLIQPIFDIDFFYNSISTLIRVIFILILFLYYFITSKNIHKYWLLLYPFIIWIYFIFHHLNALNFHSLVPNNFNYSILEEGLYFFKMISPFLLIYCLYKSNISVNTIFNIIKFYVLIISLIIIISNLFVFSYGNYSSTTIKANFLEWFNPNSVYNYQDLASKGIFKYGNQIGAVLLMFLPFVLVSALKNHTVINIITLICNIFALLLLCTRVSVFGILIVLAYTAFSLQFVAIIQKKPLKTKKLLPIGIILLVYCLILPFNPMFSKLDERNNIISTFNEQNLSQSQDETPNSTDVLPNIELVEPNSDKKDTYDYRIKYIEENYKNKKLHEQFLFENYPYKYDPDFWYNFLQQDISLTTDYRYIELSMIRRVVEINNNPADKWLGITNTRLQNIFNIEKDFVVQYYALRYNRYNFSFFTLFYNSYKIYI